MQRFMYIHHRIFVIAKNLNQPTCPTIGESLEVTHTATLVQTPNPHTCQLSLQIHFLQVMSWIILFPIIKRLSRNT